MCRPNGSLESSDKHFECLFAVSSSATSQVKSQCQHAPRSLADSNTPMLAINSEMGFVPYVEFTTRQADLATVKRALGRKAVLG